MVSEWLEHEGLSSASKAAFAVHTTSGDARLRATYLSRLVQSAAEKERLKELNACIVLLQDVTHPDYGKRLRALYLSSLVLGETKVGSLMPAGGNDAQLVRRVLNHALGQFKDVGSGHPDWRTLNYYRRTLRG